MDIEGYRTASREIWNNMAQGWGERRDYIWETSRAVGEQMVDALDLEPGQTVLELAAGPGDTGFAAAALVGEDGKLISTDFSEQMVQTARERGRELGLQNVEYRVMDAEQMDLEADSIDGVLCRWGYMLMADPAAAFAETKRVLRPGRRVSFSVWGDAEDNPFASVPGRVLVQRGHLPPPEPGAPGIFAMADSERIRELVSGAGFSAPRMTDMAMTWRFDDFDDFWTYVNQIAGPLAVVVAGLSDQDRSAVREQVEANLEPFRADGGYAVPAMTRNVVAE